MSWDVYKKAIDDLCGFPHPLKLKLLVFAGLGEPLLHPQIAEMVAYAKKREVAGTVRIITNASLLTHKMSDSLIEAGLDSLKISLQGVTEETHRKWGGTSIPLARIKDNIKYFYEHKKDTVVNVKIVSDAFQEPDDEQRFYDMFEPICDIMNIEHVERVTEDVDFDAIGIDSTMGIVGNENARNQICQLPFYYLSIYQDGEILPCCTCMFENYKKISLGNVLETSLVELWNGEKMNKFRLCLLEGKRNQIPVCSTCTNFQAQCQPGDNIDPYAPQLIEKFSKLIDRK